MGMEVAVLGMGRMGTALAGRLLRGGHEVVVWNRSPGKVTKLVSAGAREADSIARTMRTAEVALTSLSDDAAVREVALGEAGVRASIGDRTYVECSTVSPKLTGELAEVFARFVAMPVLGGPASVESGEATYLVGTSDATRRLITPILTSLGGALHHYSSAPLASTAKLAVNLLRLTEVVSLAEAFAVGRAGGLVDAQLRELLWDVVAPGIRNRFEALLGIPQGGWWTTLLGAKDVGLAVDLGKGTGVELRVAVAVQDAFRRVATAGYEDDDIAAVHHLYRA